MPRKQQQRYAPPEEMRGPHYHIDCEKLDQGMLVNRAFLRRFVAGWEQRNPHIVTRKVDTGENTWHASREYGGCVWGGTLEALFCRWGNSQQPWEEEPEWQQQQQLQQQDGPFPPPPEWQQQQWSSPPPQPEWQQQQQQWSSPPPQPEWQQQPGPFPPPPPPTDYPPPQVQDHPPGAPIVAGSPPPGTDRQVESRPRGFACGGAAGRRCARLSSGGAKLTLDEKLRRARAQHFEWQRQNALDPASAQSQWSPPPPTRSVHSPTPAPRAAAAAPHAAFRGPAPAPPAPAVRSRGLDAAPVYPPSPAPAAQYSVQPLSTSSAASTAQPLPGSTALLQRMQRLEDDMSRCEEAGAASGRQRHCQADVRRTDRWLAANSPAREGR